MYKASDYFTLTKRPNGIWNYYCYTDENKRIMRSTNQRKRADALKVIQERIAEGTLVNPNGCYKRYLKKGSLFKDYFANFFIQGKCPIIDSNNKRGVKITKAQYCNLRGYLINYIMPFFGEYEVSRINPYLVNTWILSLPSKYNIAHSTCNKAFSALSKLFDFALFAGVVDSNPCKNVKRLYSDDKRRDAFSDEQIKQLLNYDWGCLLNSTIVKLALYTGMRQGEIRSLMWKNIEGTTIHIRTSINPKDGIKCTKTNKEREVPIPESLLKDLIKIRIVGCPYVFSLTGIKPIGAKYIQNFFKEAIKNLGFEGYLTFHSMRHYFNTYLIKNGVNESVTRAVVGHSSVTMTDRYLHLHAQDMIDIQALQKNLC